MLFTGCGGGSSSSLPTIDNSNVGGIETYDGYYAGDNVLFAGVKIVGGWTFYQPPASGSESAYFHNDGDTTIRESHYVYGDSKDDREIYAAWFTTVQIIYKSTRKDYLHVTESNGDVSVYDCYDVELTDNTGIYDLIMCPSV